MNVQSVETGVVHVVTQEPQRPTRDQHATGGMSGMTECVEYFRWWGQSAWQYDEMVGEPIESPVTCLFCLTGL